jgi:hypothetical protein
LAKTPEEKQNQFCPGDFILFKPKTVASKLTCQYPGPYEVVAQYKNDITCRHCTQGKVSVLHVENVKLFIGNREQALAAAQLDFDQYVIQSIIAYKGSIDKRSGMSFKIIFGDGDIRWVPFSADIFATIQYEDYCNSLPFLKPLTKILKDVPAYIQEIKRQRITKASPDTTCFVDIRHWGADWAYALELPDFDHTRYVVEGVYKRFTNKEKKSITVRFPVFKLTLTVDNYWVTSHGLMVAPPDGAVVIDLDFVAQFPQVLLSE